MRFVTSDFKMGNSTAFMALAVLTLLTMGVATAIIAAGSLYSTNMFFTSLSGSTAEGSLFSARTHTSTNTGTNNAQGGSYVANIGVFGNSIFSSQPPSILGINIFPRIIGNTSSLFLFINSRYASGTFANVTLPNGTVNLVALQNAQNTTYSGTPIVGTYQVLFFANNSNGVALQADSFDVKEMQRFLLRVQNTSLSGVASNARIESSGFIYAENASVGDFDFNLPDITYTLTINTAESTSFLLEGVNITTESGKNITLYSFTEAGSLKTFTIDNQVSSTNATVKLNYSGLVFNDESYLRLYSCSSYNTSARACLTSWIDVTSNATQDSANDYFEYRTVPFVSFQIRDETPPPEEEEEEPRSRRSFFKGREGMVVKSESDCIGGTTKITVVSEKESEPVDIVLITVRGKDFYTSQFSTDKTGSITLKLESGAYYVLAKSEKYADGTETIIVDCEDKWIETPIVESPAADEPRPEKDNTVHFRNETNTSIQGNAIVEPPQEQKPEEIVAEKTLEQAKEQEQETDWLSISGLAFILLTITILILILNKSGKRRRENAPEKAPDKKSAGETPVLIGKVEEKKEEYLEKLEIPKINIYPEEEKRPEAEEKTSPKTILVKAEANDEAVVQHRKVRFSPLLRDLAPEEHFILLNGERIRSLAGLITGLKHMTEDTFRYHVTEYKNDFATWIYHAVGDKELAERIGGVKSKEAILDEVHERIKELITFE
jgi:hypothetical protein